MDYGKKSVLEEEWIPSFVEDNNIDLECKECGNKSIFYFRETTGATFYPPNSAHNKENDKLFVFGGFEEITIECTNCGNIIHNKSF